MEDIPVKIDGESVLPAAEWNQLPAELEAAITDTGQGLSGGILDQISKAMSIYAGGGDFYTDSGVADAYVLTVVGAKKAPVAYFNGMSVRFLPGNVNGGGAATVNVASLGVKNIKLADGATDPEAGQLPGSAEITLTYDGTNFRITNVSAPLIIRVLGNADQPGEIRLLEDTDNGVNYIGFKAPALVTANTVFELPDGDGAAGEFLQTNGSKVLSFAAQTGSWTKIQSQTASASATIDFTTGIDGTFDIYKVVISQLVPATDNTTLLCRISLDGGSTWKAGASDYAWVGHIKTNGAIVAQQDSSDSSMALCGTTASTSLGNVAGESYSSEVTFDSPASSTTFLKMIATEGHLDTTPIEALFMGSYLAATTAVDGFRFLLSSGNITSGVLTLYGLVK